MDVLAGSLDHIFCCVVVSADVLLDIGQQWTGTPSPHYRLSIMNGGHCHLSNGTGLLDCTDPYNITIRDFIGLHTIMVAAITYYAA